jgi:hypothetical protein
MDAVRLTVSGDREGAAGLVRLLVLVLDSSPGARGVSARSRYDVVDTVAAAGAVADPGREVHGVEATDLPAGTVHPLLERFGWLDSRWEHLDRQESGRPARRYCRLTGTGVVQAEEALASMRLPSGLLARLRPDMLLAGDERWPGPGVVR